MVEYIFYNEINVTIGCINFEISHTRELFSVTGYIKGHSIKLHCVTKLIVIHKKLCRGLVVVTMN